MMRSMTPIPSKVFAIPQRLMRAFERPVEADTAGTRFMIMNATIRYFPIALILFRFRIMFICSPCL